jgi:hypothetical protein
MPNILAPFSSNFSVQQAFRDHLIERERARQSEYIRAREYFDGIHNTVLTDRMRSFLNVSSGLDFTVNYCPMIVNAKAERLEVIGFGTKDDQNEILWDWWRRNRMDKTQKIVHKAAVRDGDSFVLVEWDEIANIPRFHFEPAYAGDGVMVYYSEERRTEIEFASKHWRIEHGHGAGNTRRINLYFPNRIEKYISIDSQAAGRWLPFIDDKDTDAIVMEGRLGQAGVSWWTETGREDGDPLGIPVFHFAHNDMGNGFGVSQLSSVMPIQDAVNKTMIDLLGSADSAGFGLLVGYGTTDWENVSMGPGAIAAVTAPPTDAKLERLPADSPQGLLNTYKALVMELFRVSGTPLSYAQASGQVAAEGTMKQQEIALVAQVEDTQVNFGNTWEDVLIMGRRLHNTFGIGTTPLDEDILIDTIWEEAESRNDREQAETLSIKVEKLGVSEEQAQVELGYDAEERASFMRAKLRQQAVSIRRAATVASPQLQSNNLTQTENEATNEGNGASSTA